MILHVCPWGKRNQYHDKKFIIVPSRSIITGWLFFATSLAENNNKVIKNQAA